MRDDDPRAVAQQRVERAMHPGFGERLEVRGRLAKEPPAPCHSAVSGRQSIAS